MIAAAPARYNRYDTSLVCLFALGKEHMVPDHLRSAVPHSTASGWRRLDMDQLVGHELRSMHQEALDFHEVMSRYSRLRACVLVLAKVWASVSDLVLPALRERAHNERFVGALQLLFTAVKRRRALRWGGISSSAFADRLAQVKVRCGLSPLDRCFKRHPLQLALREVQLIKELFRDEALACWPAVSRYFHGVRYRGLRISLSTFYKYVSLLGLSRPRYPHTPKRVGLRASAPNQYLHVDTTEWPLLDESTAYIAIVCDNFSKAVLGWSVSVSKRADNVLSALRKAIATIRCYHPQQQCAVLVADGGGENHAVCIEELLASEQHPLITKIIAQEHIRFSNSAIEAINKVLKQYLRHHKPVTLAATEAAVAFALNNYSAVRPHGSLDGLIPMERYVLPDSALNFRNDIHEGRALRIQRNRVVNCTTCTTTT